jgi:hypothetical protein
MVKSLVQPVPGKFINFIKFAQDANWPTAESQQPIASSPSRYTAYRFCEETVHR